MLEIPESSTMSEQLNSTIKGKTIQNVYANSSPHKFAWYFGDPANYQSLLSGKIISGAKAVAGQVEISAENTKILLSDGTRISYLIAGEKLPQKHQLHLEFDDNSSIICSVQMYGGLSAFIDGENENPYYLVAKEKPSPLSDEFSKEYFSKFFTEKTEKLSVKAFLATEQRIPGLGNGVLQDILFNAKIHPKRKMSTLTDAELETIFQSIKLTLFEMTVKGGRDTEKDLFGCSGGYKTKLSSKTLKNPCPICGDTIVREAYLGGNIYYCPTCQRLEMTN